MHTIEKTNNHHDDHGNHDNDNEIKYLTAIDINILIYLILFFFVFCFIISFRFIYSFILKTPTLLRLQFFFSSFFSILILINYEF